MTYEDDIDRIMAGDTIEQARWEAWWDDLTPEQQEQEREMMAAHVADVEERKARGEIG